MAIAGATATGRASPENSPPSRVTAPASKPVRLAFIDDHPMLLKGLATLFRPEEGFAIVGSGATADDMMRTAADHHPDVMIVDLSMPGNVYAALKEISVAHPGMGLVVFTAYDETDVALKAMDAGAHAFVVKGAPADDLLGAIEAVRRGEIYVSPCFTDKLVSAMRNEATRTRSAPLSFRESQIVELLLRGQTNKEIARSLDLTEKTIKHYMTNLMVKLGVRNRVEVVLAVKTRGVGIAEAPGPGATRPVPVGSLP